MARKFREGLDVAGEATVFRVVRVGPVQRWLVLDTPLDDNTAEMGQLQKAAHDFLEKNSQFEGVEIRGSRKG
jgi:hypothetical protein